MTLRTSAVNSSLFKLAAAWPKDAVRPKFQFSQAIEQSANRAFPASIDRTLSPEEAHHAEQMITSLDNLFANKAISQVCFSFYSHLWYHSWKVDFCHARASTLCQNEP